jgi:two-component system, NarL family, sensor histidine kinase UhpB
MSDSNLKILVVEDNMGDYFLVHEYLHSNFTNPLITHNELLEDAHRSLANDHFDVILLDLTLPDSNGKESVDSVVKLANDAPVIVLTGYSDRQFAMDSLKLGVQDYLIKDEVNAFVLQKSITYSIERNKIGKTLLQNEKRFRALIENSTDGLVVCSTDRTIQDLSSAGQKIIGYSKEDLSVILREDLVHPDDFDHTREAFLKVQEQQNAIVSMEYRFLHPDKGYIWLESSFHNLLFEPSVKGIVEHFKNISDRKAAEESIKLSEEKLEEEKNKKQMEITEAVITAQERERQEIGLELHDNVNQILAGSLMYLGLLKKELNITSELFTDIDKLITGAINEIRRLSHSLIPPSLNEVPLGEALDHFITVMKKAGLFEIKKDLYDFNEDAISDKLKLAIYRIVQEQFTNIFKHARAKNILIRLYHENGILKLTIKDDGVGFNAATVSRGVGLINIQTRASLFNGTTEIISSPGEGTELVVIFS